MKLLLLHEYLCAQKDCDMTIWDSLAFLAAKLIGQEKIENIQIESFSYTFEKTYGYKIPFHPLKTIIGKMIESELLKKDDFTNTIKPIFSSINEYVRKNETKPVDLSIIVKNIWLYIDEKIDTNDYTFEEVEEGVLKYLQIHQYEIINGIVKDIDFSINVDEELQFYINQFLFEKMNSSYEYKNLILDLIIANINLSSIFFEIDDSIDCNCLVFLDTRIIFRLMGVEGEYRKNEYEIFIQQLQNKGFKLCIFENHYDEIKSNIQESIEYAKDRTNFRSDLASPLSCYFYNNNMSQSDMDLFQCNLENKLSEYNIITPDTDEESMIPILEYEKEENNQYNIDETKLYSLISKEYLGEKTTKTNIDDPKIWTDIKAISKVYRLRQGKNTDKIDGIKFIFLTSNSALSRANKNYKLNENVKYNKFQECLTDTFLGSYLWINSNKDVEIIKRKLLSASYEYIQAKLDVKKAFIEKVENQKDNFKKEQYYWLRSLVGKDSSKIAIKSRNIVDNILDSTPEELLREHDEEIRKQVQDEANKKIEKITSLYNSEKEQSNNLQNTVDIQSSEKEETIKSIINDSERKAKKISITIGIFFGLVLITDFILKFITDISLWIIIPIGLFMLIITFLSLYFGFTVKGFTKKLKENLIKKTCERFKIKFVFNKENE